MEQPRFQHSDAWILTSMAFYQGRTGTSLRDLIATADYINHAIPSEDEIEGAINRLGTAGLVTVEDDYFYVTRAGREALRQFHRKGVRLLQVWELLENYLATAELPSLEFPAFKLKSGQLKTASNSYYDLISTSKEKSARKKKVAE